ncbi:MAG: adenosylcobalamin-dependent ribonucleoside-diphosphate reductase [Candidatus Aenigmarchaeota archaeon]|nr:adenosylcobalamin-dependent ribonucleoside-diphosphate reductase [Candidatus Aenigmarchaeota archaeon]
MTQIPLSEKALRILRERYLQKDEKDRILESPEHMFRRVAHTVAQPDIIYEGHDSSTKTESEFYEMMVNLEFLPNSPTLMNAGTELGQLAACFVIPVSDSIDGIFGAVKLMAKIHQSGGGTGFSFSNLRPEGDVVKSTKGVASGPISFMGIFDKATDVIKQGGRRRGANMAILSIDHPDIMKFIGMKNAAGVFSNFNLSVGVTDDFMRKAEKGQAYYLINPRTKKPVKSINAAKVFDLIAKNAWMHGDPGIVFLDEINRKNPTPALGEIEGTNPCGEAPLLSYESCNLGSINLSKFVSSGKIEFEKLERTVRKAVHFLDNVIDANRHPVPEIEKATKMNRKIGLGVMGFADMLILLGISYASEQAVTTAEKVMKFIQETAVNESEKMAVKRGAFPNFEKSVLKRRTRNATLTAIAPTGSISMIADCSPGIEPIFGLSSTRMILGKKFSEVNSLFERIAKEKGFYSQELISQAAKNGTLKGANISKEIKALFATATEIAPEWHVRIQASFQKYIDNAVSKTVNLPADAKVSDVRKVFMLAWKLKCKGVTVYRYGSKPVQVLYLGKTKK